MLYRLSPSDLTYLFEGCKYCFSLKVKQKIGQPSMPMASIFSSIAGKQKAFYENKRTEEFCRELPPGIIQYGEKWVESTPIHFENTDSSCCIAGRFDLVVNFDDGSYGVIDCKTARPSEKKTLMYGRQLQCYTYALENAMPGKLALSPITKLGVLYFEPLGLDQVSEKEQAFRGELVWHGVERDDNSFLDFLSGVIKVLDSKEIYPTTCEFCAYCQSGNTCLAGKQDAYEKGCICCAWCVYRTKMRDIDKGGLIPLVLPQVEDSPICPSCGSAMNRKSGKFGEFWSCQKYPDCRGTRNIEV